MLSFTHNDDIRREDIRRDVQWSALICQFTSPAERKRADRMEARGLGDARTYITDLTTMRILRLGEQGTD